MTGSTVRRLHDLADRIEQGMQPPYSIDCDVMELAYYLHQLGELEALLPYMTDTRVEHTGGGFPVVVWGTIAGCPARVAIEEEIAVDTTKVPEPHLTPGLAALLSAASTTTGDVS